MKLAARERRDRERELELEDQAQQQRRTEQAALFRELEKRSVSSACTPGAEVLMRTASSSLRAQPACLPCRYLLRQHTSLHVHVRVLVCMRGTAMTRMRAGNE